jgi:hypothetical protein
MFLRKAHKILVENPGISRKEFLKVFFPSDQNTKKSKSLFGSYGSNKQSFESCTQSSVSTTDVFKIGGDLQTDPPQKKKKFNKVDNENENETTGRRGTLSHQTTGETDQQSLEINLKKTKHWETLEKSVEEKLSLLDLESIMELSGIFDKMLEVANNLANLRHIESDITTFKFEDRESIGFLILPDDIFILHGHISNIFYIVKNVVFYTGFQKEPSKDLTMEERRQRCLTFYESKDVTKYIPVGYQFDNKKILLFDTLSFFD